MDKGRVVIVGGSGFVGSHLTKRLLANGMPVRVLSRQAQGRHPLPKEAEFVRCNVHDTTALGDCLKDCSIAINLVGILNEREHDGQGFQQAHVVLAKKIVEACHTNGIERLLHMSALGADAKNGPSFYLRTKGEAEDAVHTSGLKVTSFRPSVIFGEGDSFLNRFAKLLAIPGPFPLACSSARFAPIWVEDVVECFAQSINNEQTIGQRYDLCGPNEYTLEELVRYTAKLKGKKKWIVPLGDTLSAMQASVMEYLPGKPFSRDNYNSTKSPSVCDGNFPVVFDFNPHTLEDIAPDYIHKMSR